MKKIKASWLAIWGFCPYQLYLQLRHGPILTDKMMNGKRAHEALYNDFMKEAIELPPGTDLIEYGSKNTFFTREIFLECKELIGRIDELYVDRGVFVPIEDKFTKIEEDEPQYPHILQLWAYSFIIERNGGKVDYGVIRYVNKEFKIAYDKKAREAVLKAIHQINLMLEGKIKKEDLKPRDTKLCGKCIYNSYCDKFCDKKKI
jgi:CRISPR-associated exonuclease Cas4